MRTHRPARSLLALALTLAFVVGAPVHAQHDAVAVTSLVWPVRLAATLRRDRDTFGARTSEAARASARVTLQVDEGGAARLTLHGERAVLRGPSPLAPVSTRAAWAQEHEEHRITWYGRVRGSAETLVVELDRVEHGAHAPEPFAGAIACAIETAPVLPATPALDERATPLTLARCTWPEPPAPFAVYAGDAPWLFGLGRGVHATLLEAGAHRARWAARLPP